MDNIRNITNNIIDSIKKFRFNSILVRNFILILLIVVIPFTTLGLILRHTMLMAVDKEINVISEKFLETAMKTVENTIDTVEMYAIQLSYNNNVDSFAFFSGMNSSNVSKIQSNIKDNISSFKNTHEYVHSVYVYAEKNNLIVANNEVCNIDSFLDCNWMATYKASTPSGTTIISRKYTDLYPRFISIMRSIGYENDEKKGCIVVNIDVEKLNEMIYEDADKKANIIMIDDNNRIYLSKNTGDIDKLFERKHISNTGRDVRIYEDEFMYFNMPSKRQGFRFILEMEGIYFKKIVKHTNLYILVMLIAILFLTMLIALHISLRTYAPIREFMNFVSSNDASISDKTALNEIVYIEENIRNSLEKTKEIEKEYSYRIMMLDKAQMYALQTQINPHFINNILDIINWSAVKEYGVSNKTSKLIRSLSSLLEISLDVEHYMVSLEEEMCHANIYIYIMSQNYGDELDFIWDLDDNMQSCVIPKITLQPILENAIEHGIKPKDDKGVITIVGRINDNLAEITITDDGIGMSPEALEELQHKLENIYEIPDKHIGIQNVNQRIKLIYGEKYGISIESQKNVGTSVKISIPKVNFDTHKEV